MPGTSRAILTTMCLVWASSVAAQTFTVQIGAFREPAAGFVGAAQDHGEVVRESNAEGLTLVSVGRFEDRDSAEALRVKMAGSYPDAYVRRIRSGNSSVRATAPSTTSARASATRTVRAGSLNGLTEAELRTGDGPLLRGSARDKQLWQGLSYEDQQRVVTLDGQLHIKLDDRFVPLSQYQR